MRDFLSFMFLQFVSYLNLTINIRAISTESYVGAIVTDGIACVVSWTIVKRIGKANTSIGVVGAAIGGMAASALGIWLTRHWR